MSPDCERLLNHALVLPGDVHRLHQLLEVQKIREDKPGVVGFVVATVLKLRPVDAIYSFVRRRHLGDAVDDLQTCSKSKGLDPSVSVVFNIRDILQNPRRV